MSPDPVPIAAGCPGLVWGFDFTAGVARALTDRDLQTDRPADADFRWLHLSLADQRTRRWLEGESFPTPIKELLLSGDEHQRVVVEEEAVAFVLQDIERDFDIAEIRFGVIRFALTASLMITLRSHPLRSADVVRRQLINGAGCPDAAAALELVLAGMAEVGRSVVGDMDEAIQEVEEELLKDGRPPDTRAFVNMRSVMARLRRQLGGARMVLRRLDEVPALPAALRPVIDRASFRLTATDTDLVALQSQLRLLREELDLQATQQTNQNLYVLSIMTALMLPATLVTGFFGMNTGGMPLAHGWWGTVLAGALAAGSAIVVYMALRLMGLVRR